MRINRLISIQISKPKKSAPDSKFLQDREPDVDQQATDAEPIYIRTDNKADLIKAVALLTLVNGALVIGGVYAIDYLRKQNH